MTPIERKFEQLKSIALAAKEYYWRSAGAMNQYHGPVVPIGICQCTKNKTNEVINYLVLAEHVNKSSVMDWRGDAGEIVVLAILDEHLDFSLWVPHNARLGRIVFRGAPTVEQISEKYDEVWKWIFDSRNK